MAQRGLLLALFVVLAGFCVYAGSLPTMSDQYVTTSQGEPVLFTLRAEDLDIDPAYPESHPLTFVILEGPAHGVLLGDPASVRYEEPHSALVDFIYIPGTWFIGTDSITVSVTDPFGESIRTVSTVQIDVQVQRLVGILSGNWEMSMSLNVQSVSDGLLL